MTRLLLIRHGETEWNQSGRYQGQTDVPLSEVGLAQAQALARRLAGETLHAVYTSDLSRARQTAEAIAAPHGLAVRPDPRLRELDFGQWEGLTYAQVLERDPEARAFWDSGDPSAKPPGGESREQMLERVRLVLADLARHEDGQTLAVVGHGGSLKLLLCLALGMAPTRYWQLRLDNASLSELSLYEKGAILSSLNDFQHLEEMASGSVLQRPDEKSAGRLILILGGARSGKSTWAQQLALALGGEDVLFVATAEAGDTEMRQRIEAHRRERPASWRTLEAPRAVGPAIAAVAGEARAVVVDCLTLLVSNTVLASGDPADEAAACAAVDAEVEGLLRVREDSAATLIVVSNEVGMGLVPPYPLGRLFRDLLGRANQSLAAGAEEVYLMVAGQALDLKALATRR